MTEPKPARKMSEKMRERLETQLVAERVLLRSLLENVYFSDTKAVDDSLAFNIVYSARTIARIARRLAKAGA